MEHVHAAKDVVKHLKTFPMTLRVHAIPEDQVRLILIADSAFDTSGKEKSQHGWLLGFTNPMMNPGKLAPVSLMQWRSKRLRRKASSSLLREAISMSAATGALERLDAFFQSISLSEISPRRKLQSEDQYLEASGKATVIANDSSTYRDPHGLCVMDAKSLFDALNSEQSQGDDDRSALETAIISESLSACRGRLRWVPHNMNPANSMTKSVGGHHETVVEAVANRKIHYWRGREANNLNIGWKQAKPAVRLLGNRFFWGWETWSRLCNISTESQLSRATAYPCLSPADVLGTSSDQRDLVLWPHCMAVFRFVVWLPLCFDPTV